MSAIPFGLALSLNLFGISLVAASLLLRFAPARRFAGARTRLDYTDAYFVVGDFGTCPPYATACKGGFPVNIARLHVPKAFRVSDDDSISLDLEFADMRAVLDPARPIVARLAGPDLEVVPPDSMAGPRLQQSFTDAHFTWLVKAHSAGRRFAYLSLGNINTNAFRRVTTSGETPTGRADDKTDGDQHLTNPYAIALQVNRDPLAAEFWITGGFGVIAFLLTWPVTLGWLRRKGIISAEDQVTPSYTRPSSDPRRPSAESAPSDVLQPPASTPSTVDDSRSPEPRVKVYLSERSPDEVVARIRSLKPLERQSVVNETYVGRWVRWHGTILTIDQFALGQENGFTANVLLRSDDRVFGRLEFRSNERHLVEPLQEGEFISYEARVSRVHDASIYLTDAIITQPERSYSDVTPEHLTGLCSGELTSVQADRRVAPFLGKWLRLSGTVDGVIASSPSFAQVTLADRSLATANAVYMYFRGGWVGRVSGLRSGDRIEVVGRISAVDWGKVALDNCELIT